MLSLSGWKKDRTGPFSLRKFTLALLAVGQWFLLSIEVK